MAGHDQPIHMPPPSLSPVTIGVGVTLISFGLLWSLILVAVGGLILLAGLATWLIDDARAYSQASDEGGHH